MTTSIAVSGAVMRGGTSRGLVLDGRRLPSDRDAREAVVAAMFGAGSPGQIDGLGGGVPHTSKVAIVTPSDSPDADVEYLFGQVSTTEPVVDFSGTCGNMASAVALFAAEEGMVPPGSSRVRIQQAGADQVLVGELPSGPVPPVRGGLPGTGSPVLLDLAGMAGASAGAMLPTGTAAQYLTIPGIGELLCSVVDVGNVLGFVPAEAFGLTGHERPEDIEALPVMTALAQVRGALAVALGWTDDPELFLQQPGRLPFVALVGTPAPDEPADVVVRLYAVGRIHRSIAVTAVAAVGAAAAIQGSVVNLRLSRPFFELAEGGADVSLRVAHAAGVAEIGVASTEPSEAGEDQLVLPHSLRYLRTARRLMQGDIFVEVDDSVADRLTNSSLTTT
jgi:2-methylaconitate cis-trans-isomerase PrpF